MPITIFDYVKFIVGEKREYTAADFTSNGVAMLGGCENCHAMLAAYNAYPSKSGYWRCADCIGGTGFDTVEEFAAYMAPETCPACGEVSNVRELHIPGADPREAHFECGECGAAWPT